MPLAMNQPELGGGQPEHRPHTVTHARTPPPRPLGANETLESLTHWKTTFRTFYKRDDAYKPLIRETTVWNPADPNYGQAAENNGLKRTAPDVKEDLVDLLHILAGYLPNAYLTDKIVKETKSWKDVYNIIYDHYGVQITCESLLDFESLHKETGETHRQFYERLLQHVKQHLAPVQARVDRTINTSADTMNISMMNMVALQWLRKTDPSLIDIVRTEYSTELRDNIQLAELVPRIAINIDSLLRRYNIGATSNKVNIMEDKLRTVDEANVNRTWTRGGSGSQQVGGRGQLRGQSSRGGGSYRGGQPAERGRTGPPRGQRVPGMFCPGCYYLSQQLGTVLHYRHTPYDCPRKTTTVKLLQMEDSEYFENGHEDEDSFYVGKINNCGEKAQSINNQLQIPKRKCEQGLLNININLSSPETAEDKLSSAAPNENSDVPGQFKNIDVSDKWVKMKPSSIMATSAAMEQNFREGRDETFFQAAVRRLQERRRLDQNDKVRKEKSPTVAIDINNVASLATVDEGSEINCMDEKFAIKNKIQFIPTLCTATAAGSNSMKLAGQTFRDIVLDVKGSEFPVHWDLGKVVIVSNLGLDILVGEPGKADNKIITIPHQKIIETVDSKGKVVKIPYSLKRMTSETIYSTCRAVQSETLYPGQELIYKVPKQFQTCSYVNVSPRRMHYYPWVECRNYKVNKNGEIVIKNTTEDSVKINKNDHFADMRDCQEVSKDDLLSNQYVKKIYDLNISDTSHLIPYNIKTPDPNETFLDQVNLDPDNQLSQEWKNKFKNVCQEYSDIINPRPGKYNGYFGRVDNSINFSSTPPPTVRAHLPNYSHEMLQILAAKMDKLENWGVLKKPEDLGIVPEFVVPSMLLPKPEKGEWRLVTDFTPLNTHIKKLETVAPTIQDAKKTLAKFKYHIQLDLSNYFYQGGMKIEDCQYLATPHPFQGLRVYTCEPQGLRNASEHAYERLARIYGDMCGQERMTRMADGLYVLGETLEELELNFREVLSRARLCGLTFKPSKISIVPVQTILFGWKKVGDGWRPTPHAVSPLSKADPPTTVKQMRGWLGSYKQITSCIPDYASLLGPLEDVVGGRSSAERIVWSKELNDCFETAKKSLNEIETVFVPKPTDTLHTYSDFSQLHKAVGGRLEIHRLSPDGSVKKLLGGHFSCRVNKHQKNWYPCEGEALAARLVIKHFSPFLKESRFPVIHHVDNMPTVQAWKRSKRGAFSTSARISAFLSGLSALDIELVYTPGQEMKSSDYNSRHPVTCNERRCQICEFANEMECLGDNVIPMVAAVMVEDIEQGKITMPFTQRNAWLKVQKKDPLHQKLSFLIDSSQLPDKKKTKGDNTNLKRLHGLYRNGVLKKAKDGLITVMHTETGGARYQTISVPSSMYPGLIQALHLLLKHPSKLQMQKLANRYFYCPGYTRIIDDISDNCAVCASLKQLPSELLSESTAQVDNFGANFSADIIKQHGQLILLCREKLSQFTTTCFIPNEGTDATRNGLISCIIEAIPDTGTVVQVDNAPALQSLKTESESDGSVLRKLNIKIDLGRTFNKNKNPVAENAIKEFHKERLRLNPSGGPVSEIELAIITKNMNSRIRSRGFSAKEIAFQRDQVSNESKVISDAKMSEEQLKKRKSQHPSLLPKVVTKFNIGDNVYIKNERNKLKAREMFKVINIFNRNDENWAIIQKANTSFRAKEYVVKTSEIFHVPGPALRDVTEENEPDLDDGPDNKSEALNVKQEEEIELAKDVTIPKLRPKREAAVKARKKIQTFEAEGLLKIDTSLDIRDVTVKEKKEPPSHAWDYDTFINHFEEEIEITTGGRLGINNNDFRIFEDSLQHPTENLLWDSSPEQYELVSAENDDLEGALTPRKLFPSSEGSNITLTSLSSDDEVFTGEVLMKRNSKLRRNNAFRKKENDKPTQQSGDDLTDAENTRRIPKTPDEVHLQEVQLLHHVLPAHTPIVPEAVHLGPNVLNHHLALDRINLPDNPDIQPDAPVVPAHVPDDLNEDLVRSRPRRSTRLSIDYKVFNKTGKTE